MALDTSSELSDIDFRLLDDLEDPLSTPESDESSVKRRKIRATTTWEHSRPATSNEPTHDSSKRKFFYCKYCTRKTWSGSITTNIRRHLSSKHNIIIEEKDSLVKIAAKKQWDSMKDKMAQKKDNSTTMAKEKVLQDAIQFPVVRQALAELIVTRNLPYEATTWPELRALLQSVNHMASDVLPLSRNTVKRYIEDEYVQDKEILKQRLLKSFSKIHLSLDCWSAPNRKTFLGIVAHFADEEFHLRKTLLGLPFLPGKHGAEEQIGPLWRCLEEYKILERIGYIVGDNHGSNDKLIRLLSAKLRKEDIRLDYNAIEHRIRCHGHIVNLAVQAFFFCETKEAVESAYQLAKERLEASGDIESEAIEEMLAELFKDVDGKLKKKKSVYAVGAPGKLHNLVVHVRSSNAYYNRFVQLAGKMIPMDNDTRWNSYELMCEVSIEPTIKEAIKIYQDEYYEELGINSYLYPSDFDELKSVVDFLRPFKRVTKLTQTDESTLDQVLATMDFLVQHYNRSTVKFAGQPKLLNCINVSWFVFDKYYSLTDQVTAYGAALLLSPNRRKAYLERNWKKAWVSRVEKNARALWKSQYKGKSSLISLLDEIQEPGTQEPDEYELWEQEQRNLTQKDADDEFDSFIKGAAFDIGKKQTALQWWLSNRHLYPNLSRMAIDILSIPPMSAEAERIFSGARRTITWSRFRLGGDAVERGECLKSWVKSGIVKDWLQMQEEEMQGT